MKTLYLITLSLLAQITTTHAVDLVAEGKAVADIVIAKDCPKGTKTAAEELQRRLAEMSGAKLAIVETPSPEVKNHVFVGESAETKKLGVTVDDVKHDGYKVIAADDHVVLVGKDIYFSATTFAKHYDKAHRLSPEAWEKLTGHKWRTPTFYGDMDYNPECGFNVNDGTGTLYAVFDLLQQLGMRWYMPVEELGIVVPKLQTISIKPQSLKKEPEFPQRRFPDPQRGKYKDQMLWFKSMMVGTSFVLPIYHAVGRLTYFGKNADRAYFGIINGKPNYQAPKLTSEKLRADFVTSLKFTRQVYPGIEYDCLGQPDGWSAMDEADAKAGWLHEERGIYGNFTDYMWDFNMDIRRRVMAENPERKFTVFAYSGTTLPPSNVTKVPDNVTVGMLQHSTEWMRAPYSSDLAVRDEWMKRMSDSKQQFLIMDHYLEHADIRSIPPVPVIHTKFLQANLKAAYDRAVGYDVELPWISTAEQRPGVSESLRRPALSHLMIYLHARMMWDRHLDLQAVLDEYYTLFYGPAQAEMKEFYEFAEQVWTRPEPREVTANGGFLKPADVKQYFAILDRAKAKVGDSIYGKRIALLAAEMEPLKVLFDNLQRNNGQIMAYPAKHPFKIDGDLTKPFWAPENGLFTPLGDLTTGTKPQHLSTSVAFRWLGNEQALVVGIECIEPKMNQLRASCKDRDSYAIFNDDTVEIRLETAGGLRPFIVVNPNGQILDECVTARSEDLANFYTVKQIAVKKLADRWTAEVLIEAKPISGTRPTLSYPWGVNICRQRMAGIVPEFYMLFPSGTKFKDPKAMGNLVMRR